MFIQYWWSLPAKKYQKINTKPYQKINFLKDFYQSSKQLFFRLFIFLLLLTCWFFSSFKFSFLFIENKLRWSFWKRYWLFLHGVYQCEHVLCKLEEIPKATVVLFLQAIDIWYRYRQKWKTDNLETFYETEQNYDLKPPITKGCKLS